MKRDALLNLPNSISLSRLILALLFVLMDGRWERTILIVAAGVTDVLDGWAARIGNSSSVAGALIDPFAHRDRLRSGTIHSRSRPLGIQGADVGQDGHGISDRHARRGAAFPSGDDIS